MYTREYLPSDCGKLIDLFFKTIHSVNRKDYTEEQLKAWAPEQIDADLWNQSFRDHYTLVAIEDDRIIGFGDIDETGYLDRLYVHHLYQNRGAATMLCEQLERRCFPGPIHTHASITAKSFFLKRGYRLIREQQTVRCGVHLTNCVMEKSWGEQENHYQNPSFQ